MSPDQSDSRALQAHGFPKKNSKRKASPDSTSTYRHLRDRLFIVFICMEYISTVSNTAEFGKQKFFTNSRRSHFQCRRMRAHTLVIGRIEMKLRPRPRFHVDQSRTRSTGNMSPSKMAASARSCRSKMANFNCKPQRSSKCYYKNNAH